MFKLKYWLIGIWLSWMLSAAYGMTTMTELNTVTLPIPAASKQDLQKAMPTAFSQVLVRLSGNTAIMTLPQIQNALANLNKYLQSYSFFTQDDSNQQTKNFVKITFDEAAVVKLLQQAGQTTWNRNRPLLLIWIQQKLPTGETVIASADDSLISNTLRKDSDWRGIPIILPAMDLQDQFYVNRSDQSFNLQKLTAALQRYQANGAFAGDISQDGIKQWTGQWLLYFNNEPIQWTSTAKDRATLLNQAFNRAVNSLANELSTDNENSQISMKVDILGVTDLNKYIKVIRYLKRLTSVAAVSVADIDDNNMVLQITLSGDMQTFVDTLRSSSHLQLLPANQLNANPVADLYYRWLN